MLHAARCCYCASRAIKRWFTASFHRSVVKFVESQHEGAAGIWLWMTTRKYYCCKVTASPKLFQDREGSLPESSPYLVIFGDYLRPLLVKFHRRILLGIRRCKQREKRWMSFSTNFNSKQWSHALCLQWCFYTNWRRIESVGADSAGKLQVSCTSCWWFFGSQPSVFLISSFKQETVWAERTDDKRGHKRGYRAT